MTSFTTTTLGSLLAPDKCSGKGKRIHLISSSWFLDGFGLHSYSVYIISYYPCSFDYDSPYIVGLGQGRIIAGMDRGLMDTCLWERRRITIPSHLGYGTRGVGEIIPANSTLVFYIRMIKIERVIIVPACERLFYCLCVVEWSSFGSRGELGGYMEARIAKLHSQTLAGGYRKNRKKFATLQHVPECYQILPKDLC